MNMQMVVGNLKSSIAGLDDVLGAAAVMVRALVAVAAMIASDKEFSDFKFIVEPSDAIVVRDKPAQLDCAAQGTPKPTIEWKRDSLFMSFVGETRRKILPNGTLYFETIVHSRSERPDEGVYQCVANIDSIGTIVSRSVKLQVASLPRFDEQPKNQDGFVGQTARFECVIPGSPPATVSWIKDGRPLVLDKSRMLVLPSGSLEIYPVEESDAGSYKCNASNVDRFKLSYSAEAREISAPHFIAQPKKTVIAEGETVTLECAANGNPKPSITWLKDGTTIDFLNLDSNYHRIGVGSLQIENIQESDEGTYMCRAENHEDSSDASADIIVQVPPRIVRRPTNQIAQAKEDVEFECEIYGKPEPTVQWLKNGDLVLSTEYFQIVNGDNLKILGSVRTDAGIYQCVGTNPAGNVQASAQLVIVDPDDGKNIAPLTTTPIYRFDEKLGLQILKEVAPSAPRDLIAVIVSTRFATLSWREPIKTNGEIISYSVYYVQETSTRERVLNTTRARLEEINVPGLRPSTKYYFRVVAYNEKGPGQSTAKISVETKSEAHVPSSPTNLRAVAVSPTTLAIQWDPPKKLNGPIEEYKLYYMQVGTSEEHETTTRLTSHILKNLRKYTEYSIWVVAINRNGPGSSTEEVFARTFSDTPAATPQNFSVEASSSTSVVIRWEPPPEESQNGIITGYKIRYKQKGKRRGETVTTDGNRRLYALTNLERGAQYNIRISALTVNGSGPVTEWQAVQTYTNDLDETRLPGEPTLTLTKPGSDSIFVSWDPPKDRTVMVRGYTIGWGKGFPDAYTEIIDENIRYFDIKNLEPAVEYVISLRAFNQLGDGIPVYDTVKTNVKSTPEPLTALDPPMELKAQVLSSSTVVLYWTDNTLSGKQANNRYYLVRYTTYYSPNPRYRYFNATDLNCMIDDLKPHTQYEFSVKVVKGRRESPWSMSVLNTTQEAPPSSAPRDLTVVADDDDPVTINLSWQPPKQPNGKLIGYVIFYTTDNTKRDRDWVVEGVGGNKLTKQITGLTLDTTYYFKIQAHNSKGYGPFSQTVVWTTTSGGISDAFLESDLTSRRSEGSLGFTLYIIIACVSIITLIIIVTVTIVVCCRRNNSFGNRRKRPYGAGKQGAKGKSVNKNLKPPDLWIHHDQMELKGNDKCKNQEPAISLTSIPRNSKDLNSDNESRMSTLDRRGNTSYIGDTPNSSCSRLSDRPPSIGRRPGRTKLMIPVDSQHRPPREPIATPISNGNLSNDGAGSSLLGRPMYPRTQYNTTRAHVSLDPAASEMPSPSTYNQSQPPTYDQLVSNPSPSDPALQNSSEESTAEQSPNNPAAVSSTPTCDQPGSNGTLGRRPSGHPLKSFSVPAPPPQSAPSTPQTKHPRPQASASPNKKTVPTPPVVNTTPGKTRGAGVSIVTPRVPAEAIKNEDLPPSYSTEELNLEMANLEGLMKDLNAITASQFECS
ncbi:Neogenin [Nymphon striatum]|nr:Neogenin [Nymphon striatum]